MSTPFLPEQSADAAAFLVLEDGTVYPGVGFGATGLTTGEIVFATGMTGYQETLTDPSYHRQIVVMTTPHVGNTGMNKDDPESSAIWVAGFVIRDLTLVASSWRATSTLAEDLAAADVVGIAEVDTRAVTRHIRSAGAMKAGIFSGQEAQRDRDEMIRIVRDQPDMQGAHLSNDVSTSEPYVIPAVGDVRFRIVAVDLGIKSMTPELLAQRGVESIVVPESTPIDQILAYQPDGIFLSNGPGDPAAATHAVDIVTAALDRRIPLFGICFGNQMLARALGLSTYKLTFGHRGINQPVQDLATGTVAITAHNHGFAVEAPEDDFTTPWGPARVSHRCLNDGVVEGLRLLDVPAFSVQYHPEAAAGPHDAEYLFDQFCADMQAAKGDA